MMTIKEIIENIEWETGVKVDEKKFEEMFEQENNEEILIYGSNAQIEFIEKFLN